MNLSRLIKSFYNRLYNFVLSKYYSLYKIDDNKIIMWSFDGKAFSCNPKYITKYIIDNKKDYSLVWCFNEPSRFNFLLNRGIKIVKYKSKAFFRELMTSKFVITNSRIMMDFYKRKNQVYIQTWHGTLAIKSIEKDAEKTLSSSYLRYAKKDSKNIDYLLSSCAANTEMFKRCFWYNGKIVECGNPRNDIFFASDNCRAIIEKKYNIKNKKIVLYAPTFRKNGSTDCYDINYDNLVKTIDEKYKCKSVVLTRLHPNLKGKKLTGTDSKFVIDVTDYDDMQELLSAADILVTDFSSSVFDFAIMNKICFLYASDYDQYVNNERKLYFNIKKEFPFSFASNNDELLNNIRLFDAKKYYNKLKKFNKEICFFDDGHASERVVNIIEKDRNGN